MKSIARMADASGKRSFRSLAGVLTAMAVSLTGIRVSAIALPWFVLVTTGSATRTGLVAFSEMTPYVMVKAFGGPLVDRVGPRADSWTTDSVSAAAAGLVPLLHALDLLSFWHLLVLVALLGPMAGLVVNAVCFALGSMIIALVLQRGIGRAAVEEPAPNRDKGPGYWRRFGEGFAFLRGEPLLLTIVVMVGVTNLLDAAFMTVLLPVWGKESGGGAAAIGLIESAFGVAAVGGSLIAVAVAQRMQRRVVFLTGFLVIGAPRFLILAFDVPMWAVLAVFAVAGFGGGFLNPILGAIASAASISGSERSRITGTADEPADASRF